MSSLGKNPLDYPFGVHHKLYDLPVTDKRREVALNFLTRNGGVFVAHDAVQDVVLCRLDKRVCFVETVQHGYWVLTIDLVLRKTDVPDTELKAGSIIGQDDGEGIDVSLVEELGWHSATAVKKGDDILVD
jgi:hypothetical protein